MTNKYLFDIAKHIHDLYDISDVKVYEFLKDHLYLLIVLEIIPIHIKKFFGNRKLKLEYYVDPEIEDLNFLLINIIVNGLTVKDSLDMLSKFCKEYWVIELKDKNIRKNLMIDVRYEKD